MAQKKKLQVFISSTYSDLKEERQAAVESILTAGHIPAGMELFAAGDESQMNVIKRWIDESDVYMLILGGRYGSIEPKSEKSYIELEYEYASEKGKPLFAVVIEEGYLDEKVRKEGLKVIEKDHSEKLKVFRELVCSKVVRFWSDPKDIKLAIMETLADFSNRPEVIGWIPGSEAVNTGSVAEELARLAKENADLREQIGNLRPSLATYNGLTYEEYYKLLKRGNYSFALNENLDFKKELSNCLEKVAKIFGDEQKGFIHVFWLLRQAFQDSYESIKPENNIEKWLNSCFEFSELLGITRRNGKIYNLTEDGKNFLIRFILSTVDGEKIQAHNYYFTYDYENKEYNFE